MVAGKIILEEAFNLPEWAEMSAYQGALFTSHGSGELHAKRLVDIHGERLEKMDKYGVAFNILSMTAPGIQDFADPKEAADNAVKANDWLHEQIKQNPKRFGGFAALSMHDPKTASDELRRCVKEYGFLGSLVNDNQRTESDTPIFYDTPEWDQFWQTCVDLDVPFYLHPIAPKGVIFEKLYKDRTPLIGPCMSFANNVSLHLVSMIIKGVFDRNPKLKVIVGHFGEKIPIDLWRINHWIEDIHKKRGSITEMKHDLWHYFKTNIYITSSGDFNTAVMKFVGQQVGYDRLMFSVDYPYETFELACEWYDNIKPDNELTEEVLDHVGSGLAKKLFKLKF